MRLVLLYWLPDTNKDDSACKRGTQDLIGGQFPANDAENAGLADTFETKSASCLEIHHNLQSVVEFLHFCENGLLTARRSESIHPLTDEGGGAAGDEVLRSREIL
jgi:hypothetical protein